MAISKGNWTLGKTGGSVITDNGEGFSPYTGHSDVEYYGGYLIAESIQKKDDARLIAAAPELLAACQEFVRKVECGEARSRRSYKQMKAAIAKAKGEK
jgi:hypothetical protein